MKQKITALMLVCLMVFSFTGCKKDDYKQAKEMLDAGKYTEAKEILVVLDDYKDSAELLKECDYQIALQFLEQKKYAEAGEIFTDISSYKDSAARLTECNYQRAISLLKTNKFDEAANLFLSVMDYEDAFGYFCTTLIGKISHEYMNVAIEQFKAIEKYISENTNRFLQMRKTGVCNIDNDPEIIKMQERAEKVNQVKIEFEALLSDENIAILHNDSTIIEFKNANDTHLTNMYNFIVNFKDDMTEFILTGEDNIVPQIHSLVAEQKEIKNLTDKFHDVAEKY